MAVNDGVISVDALSFLSFCVLSHELGAQLHYAAAEPGGAWSVAVLTSFQESSEVLDYQVHMTLSKAVHFCCEAIRSSCTAAGISRK